MATTLNRRDLLKRGALVAGAAATTAPALATPDLAAAKAPRMWGPRVNTKDLPRLYAPHKAQLRTVMPGGVDYLGLVTTDRFRISRFQDRPVEYEVGFQGYFKVARANATFANGQVPTKSGPQPTWDNMHIFVNILDLRLQGHHPELGTIFVRLNPAVTSSGEILSAASLEEEAQCRIAVSTSFDLPDHKLTLAHHVPITLMNPHLTMVPPVNDKNGRAQLFNLPLYEQDQMAAIDGGTLTPPFAHLTSITYHAEDYLTPEQVAEVKTAIPGPDPNPEA